MRTAWLAFLVASATVVGCGDDGLHTSHDMAVSMDMSGEVDMATAGGDLLSYDMLHTFVTFGQFAIDYAQAFCTRAASCGVLDAAQYAACIERNTKHTGWDQDIEITKGRMMINELQCLDAVKNSLCDLSDSYVVKRQCEIFLYTPHQANGASCLSGVECTSGRCAHAMLDAGTGTQPTGCPGFCGPPLNTGDTCRIGQDCAADSYCNPGVTPNQCTKLAALGELCYAPGAPYPLGDTTKPPCQIGLNCPSFSATPAVCVMATTQMALHGACDPYQGQATNAAAPCATGMYCQVQYTASTTACSTSSTCPVYGALCSGGFCQNPSGGQCETKLANGATCDPKNEGTFGTSSLRVDNQCADGSYCYQLPAQAGPTCQPLGSANADCVRFGGNASSCKYGLFCPLGTLKCTPWFGDGQNCDTNAHCASSSINQAVCIAANADAGTYLTCQPGKNFGATCDPAFEDTLCAASDKSAPIRSTYCAPAGASGVCAPKCF